MLAVIPVRDGTPPDGAAETVAECGGEGLVIGSGTADDELLRHLGPAARHLRLLEVGEYAVARWTAVLVPHLEDEAIVLPASPDGRDLAPHLAVALERRLFAGAMEVRRDRVRVVRRGGRHEQEFHPTHPFVATLLPGIRGVASFGTAVTPRIEVLEPGGTAGAGTVEDATVVEVLPPDVRTMDLTEATRIVGGGAGLVDADRFDRLDAFAAAIGGSMGATRVITDKGWVHHDKQIGTTGVVVDPDLYLAFGISGAIQHTAGLGDPRHVISVNTDPHCPMMHMADLALVSDANATLDALMTRLAVAEQPAT